MIFDANRKHHWAKLPYDTAKIQRPAYGMRCDENSVSAQIKRQAVRVQNKVPLQCGLTNAEPHCCNSKGQREVGFENF
jgi:hypothetical protein